MTTNETTDSWTVPVDEEGVLILPDELLDNLGWKEGDYLEWIEEPDGSIILKKLDESTNESERPTSTIDARND